MIKLRTMLVALASLLAASSASAQQNFSCSVNPSAYLGLSNAGYVLVAVNGTTITQICNVSDTVGSVTPEACMGWYSSLLTWRTLGKSGFAYFSPTTVGKTACNQFTSYDVRIAYHLEAA